MSEPQAGSTDGILDLLGRIQDRVNRDYHGHDTGGPPVTPRLLQPHPPNDRKQAAQVSFYRGSKQATLRIELYSGPPLASMTLKGTDAREKGKEGSDLLWSASYAGPVDGSVQQAIEEAERLIAERALPELARYLQLERRPTHVVMADPK